jgi:hypothetical protein
MLDEKEKNNAGTYLNGGKPMKKIFFLLLCFIMVTGISCSKQKIPGDITGEESAVQTPDEMEGPPRLVMMKDGKEYETALGGFTWNTGGKIKHSETVWPPIIPDLTAFAEKDDEIIFIIEDMQKQPDSAVVKLYPENALYYEDTSEVREISTISIGAEVFIGDDRGIRFAYKFPGAGAQQDNRRYITEITMVWHGGGRETGEVTYYGRLHEAPGETVEAVESVIRDFMDATWNGLKSEASKHLSQITRNFVEQGGSMNMSTFASLSEGSGWQLLLWEDAKKEFLMMGQPIVTIASIGPDAGGPYAEAQASYEIEVQEKGVKQRWLFRENLGLQNENGGWKINRLNRVGKPVDSRTGDIGWNAVMEKEGRLLKLGPFTGVNLYQSAGSPSGKYAALITNNFGISEVWMVDITSGEAKKAFNLEPIETPGYQVRNGVTLLRVKDDGRAVIMVYGNINTGPFKGRQGFWIIEASISNKEVKTLAFVPAPRADYFESFKITGDGRYVFVQRNGKLYRIDLADGSHKVLREDMPGYLTMVLYSGDGSLMAWEIMEEGEQIINVYNPVIEKQVKLKSPDKALRIDLVGIFGNRIAASLCLPENIQQGEDGDWTVGTEKILFFDENGQVLGDILPPQGKHLGLMAYDEDSKTFFYTAGDIRSKKEPWMGDTPVKYLHSTGVYMKTDDKTEPALISEADGELIYFREIGDDIIFWYLTQYGPGGNTIEKGMLLSGDGTFKIVERNYNNMNMNEFFLTNAADRVYYRLTDTEQGKTYLKERNEDGEEVLFSGPFEIYQSRVIGSSVFIATEPANFQAYPQKAYLYIIKD